MKCLCPQNLTFLYEGPIKVTIFHIIIFKRSTRASSIHSEHQGTVLDHPDSTVSLVTWSLVPMLKVRNNTVLKHLTVSVLTILGQRKFTTVVKVHYILPGFTFG